MKAMRSIALALLSVIVLAGASVQVGAQNLITNGDMEDPWTSGGTYTVGNPVSPAIEGCYATGWTPWSQQLAPEDAHDGSAMVDPNFGHSSPDCITPSGNSFQRLIGGFGPRVNFRGGLVQAAATTPGQDYDLDAQIRVYGSGIDLTWGAIGYDLTGQTNDPLAPTIIWTPRGHVQSMDSWSQYSLRFTAASNSNGNKTSIWLMAVLPGDGDGFMDIDNVSVTPATKTLITLTDGPRVNRLSDTSYEVVWTTDRGSDSTVQYGLSKPDNDSKLTPQEPTYTSSTTQSGVTTTHSVVLTGLAPETVYHYRVKSAVSGYKTVYSLDQIFTTPGPANALFQNGDFEITDPPSPPAADGQTLPGWKTFTLNPLKSGVGGYEESDGVVTYPANQFGYWHGWAKAQHGNNFIMSASNWDTKNGGFLQRVAVTPGQTYTFSGYIGAYTYSGQWTVEPSDVRVWVGIDPNGGVDPTNPDIVWNDEAERFGTNTLPIAYVPTSVSTVATSSVITLFVRFEQKWSFEYNINIADNFTLEGPPGASTPASSIGAAKELPDGILVEITSGMIVTLVANYPETGLFYMQDAEGNAGIRVETNGAVPAVGDKVLVKGILGTNPNGERVIRDAMVTANGTGTTVVRTMANKSVGGAGYIDANLGLGTQGLLVRVFGQLKKFDIVNDFMIIDDGSNVNPLDQDGTQGLKVVHSGYFPGSLDEYLSVTGVVTSEKINGQNIRVIRGRDGLFPNDVLNLKQ